MSTQNSPANVQMATSNDAVTNVTAATPSKMSVTSTQNIGDDNDDKGSVTETLNIVVEKIYLFTDKAGAPSPTKVTTQLMMIRISHMPLISRV